MRSQSMIVGSVVLAAVVAACSSAHAATLITVNLRYLGSTTNNASSATKMAQNMGTGLHLDSSFFPFGSVSTASAGLTQYDLSNPSTQSITGLKNYFALYLDYTPNDPLNDRIYGFSANITFPAGMVPISSTGVMDTTTQKLLLFNPTDGNTGNSTWDIVGDYGGYAGDLQAVTWYQTSMDDAYTMAIGTAAALDNFDDAGYISGRGTLLGVFALAFTRFIPMFGNEISAQHLMGNVAYYSNYEPVYDDTVFRPLAAPAEPASLGMLALGGAALLVRRRRAVPRAC